MVDRSLKATEAVIQLLKLHITRAQQRIKDIANKHMTNMCFEVGDWVYLKLQPYKQVSVVVIPFNKLAAKYFGPYLIVKRIGVISYSHRLLLPADILIHPTFHVSQLKRCLEIPTIINYPPVFHLSSPYCLLSESVLERRMVKRGNKVVCQVLVKWTCIDIAQATWEYLTELQHRFRAFHP
ncbi:uncharacterized protein LOC142169554 [Nicotiana tabacum]|uniref:Uncharacterized protein LOC142169554 n=1 Tax=Nicotiana tabacum TaxID=4097 RepID=A0AC58SRC5_TOBAC